MSNVSICIILTKPSDLEDVYTQNLEGARIHVFANREILQRLKPNSAILLHEAETANLYIENHCLREVSGEWVIFRYDDEIWNKDFVSELVSFVDHNNNTLGLKYIEGFYKTENRLAHVHEINPKTKEIFTLIRIFQGPWYGVPGIKFIYPRKLAVSNNMLFNEEIHNRVLRHAIYSIDLLAALYTYNHYSKFPIKRANLSYSVPLIYSKPRQTKEYFNKLIDKHETWSKNKWSRLALESYFFKYKNRSQ